MAITTRDGLIAAIAAGPGAQFMKPSVTTVAGFVYSLFRVAGMPGAGANASTGAGNTCSRTLAGAILLPAPSNNTYLTTFQGSCVTSGVLRLADRLVETSGLSLAAIGNQTVNSTALPARASSANDVELWLDVITAGSTTASATVTCTYYNQNGSGDGSRTATLIGGIPASGVPAYRQYQFSLQAGDTGVTQALIFSSGASTGAAGNAGIVLRRRIATGVVPNANLGFVQGYAETGLERVPDDACLELLWLASGTVSGVIQGALDLAQG